MSNNSKHNYNIFLSENAIKFLELTKQTEFSGDKWYQCAYKNGDGSNFPAMLHMKIRSIYFTCWIYLPEIGRWIIDRKISDLPFVLRELSNFDEIHIKNTYGSSSKTQVDRSA